MSSLNAFAALYNRKLNDKAIEVWLRVFRSVPAEVLTKALDRVTATCVRMPTPGEVTLAIRAVYDSQYGGGPRRMEALPECGECLGTGFKVARRVDDRGNIAVRCNCRTEDTAIMEERAGRHYVDTEGEDPQTGEKIVVRLEPVTGEILYRATDCPEGRDFLIVMRAVSLEGTEKVVRRKSVAQDVTSPIWLQGLAEMNKKLDSHYSTQTLDPTLPRSSHERAAIEGATGQIIPKSKRKRR